ncbi:MAG TPA: hypothetical protein VF888_02520 [Nitrospirota bacterium]
MKIVQATILSLLAALILIVVPSSGPASGQTAPDNSAAVLPAPVNVEKGTAIPYRVLLWTGKPDSVLERALTELIVKQAFEEDGFFYRTSASAADFADQAASGLFNIFVVFEADEPPVNLDALRDRVSRGAGIVIIGPEEHSRLIAGSFGFRFLEGSPREGRSSLVFSGEAGLDLGGSVPVSGSLLLPQKPGSSPVAVYDDIGKPAVLADAAGSGRAIVMPFSIIRSAREAGITSVYSLLLRAAVRSAAQEVPEQGRVLGEELTVTSSVDHLRTQLLVTLPQGARMLGVSPGGTLRDNTILFELTAEQVPQKLQYLYEFPGGGSGRPVVELFYESDGKLVSGGMVE